MAAVEEVLEKDPRTREIQYVWTFFIKVLNTLGYKAYITFEGGMPSPESIIRSRREILNKRNKYAKDFIPEENVTYEKPKPKPNEK